MTGNRSLDEFAAREEPAADAPESPDDGPDAALAPPGTDVESDDGATRDATDDATEPEPPTTTYAWSPTGQPCGRCGETVEARWRDGADLVCASCKEW